MKRLPVVVVALALCFVLSPAAQAGNESVAKMALNAAKSNLESGYFDQCETQLDKAVEACDGLDEAVKGPILKEVEELRPKLAAARVKRKQDEIIRMLDRYIGGARNQIDEERGLSGYYDQEVERSEEALKREAPNLDPKDAARLRAELDEIKKKGAVVGLINKLKDIDRAFDEVDRDRTAGDFEGAEKGLKEIEQVLKQFPADDARVKPVVDRVTKTRSEVATALAAALKEQRDQKVKPALEAWQKLLKEQAGADAETAPDMDKFRSSTTIGEATIRRIRDIDSWFSWHKDAAREYASDAEMKAAFDQATKMRADDAEKLCKMFAQIMETIDKQPVGERDRNYEASSQVLSAVSSLEEYTKGAPSRDKVFADAKTYSAKWTSERDAAKKGAEEQLAKLVAEAQKVWAGWEKDIPASEFNALDCVQNINSYKGKTIVLKDRRNRAGWEFRSGGYDIIVPIDGTPVACKFNPEIITQAEAFKQSTGHGLETYDFHAMAAVVKGTCQVEKIEYIRALDQYVGRGMVDAPLVEIVAYSAGPLSARVGHKTSAGSDGSTVVSAGVAGGAGASTGALGWMWRVLGVLLCLVAGVACLARAKAVLVPQMAQLAGVEAKVGKENLDYLGIALATCGLLWLLVGLIYRDLLPAAALVAAGIFLAQDFLLLKGVLKEPQVSKLRPFGAMVGLACIGLGVLHLILGGLPLM
jgi:hypothetical protein